MKIMRLSDSGQPPLLVEANVPQPQPRRGELLVRVYAAGVTPTEVLWYTTTHDKGGQKRSCAVPGHEFSGVIAAMGEDTAGFAIGDEVYGMNDWFAMAPWRRLPHAAEQRCPKTTPFDAYRGRLRAIGGLTAWQGLFDRAQLQAGERILVHGGAGAVGSFAIQLARFRGAHVTATASARNLEFVSALGADREMTTAQCTLRITSRE